MVDDAGQTQGAVASSRMAAASVVDRGGAAGNNQVAAPGLNRRAAAGHGRIQPAIGLIVVVVAMLHKIIKQLIDVLTNSEEYQYSKRTMALVKLTL
ncbi:hypothetical protein DVH05_003072 [Phytophthora capsici]|nr:hypothetical protein DVH05_003072 [Phytophthora capsici]